MSFKKKFGVSFIAFMAISGIVLSQLCSNVIKSKADEAKKIESTSCENRALANIASSKVAKTEDGKIVTSDADISVDDFENQVTKATGMNVVRIGSTSQMLSYVNKKENSLMALVPIRITSVDNSTLKYFPKIENQGSLGSCTAWATVYYQFSYAVNKELNRNGKQTNNTFSPMWVYNMINEGENIGTFYSDALTILAQVGAVPTSMVPLASSNVGSTVNNVHAQKENWIEASKYKISEFYSIDLQNRKYDTVFTCNTDVDLDVIKKALATGEVLSGTTYSDKWIKQTIKTNKWVKENKNYEGESIITMCNDSGTGAHRITIVGYNDNIWVDINENGEIEKGEKGAFKIANSWGEESDNNGFVWMSYDALNKVSSLKDEGNVTLNGENRESALFDVIGFKVDVDSTDSDCFIALDLETDNADTVHVNVVAKDKNTKEVVGDYNPVPFQYADTIYNMGMYGFNGFSEDNKGEFYIDLSNVVEGITKDNIDNYDWEISIADTVDDESELSVNNVRFYTASTDAYVDMLYGVTSAINHKTVFVKYGDLKSVEVLQDVYEPEAVG